MPRDIALLTKINVNQQTSLTRQNVGSTGYVFSCFENDFLFTKGKQIRMTSGINKLIQSVLKCLLTSLGTSLEDPNYGADLESDIGGKMGLVAFANMQSNVTNALEYLMQLNPVSDDMDEVIAAVNSVQVVKNPSDPRMILVYINVTTGTGKIVAIQMPQIAS